MRCSIGNLQGYVVILQLNNNVRIAYSSTKSDIAITAGVYSEDNKRIDVFDVVDGQIYKTGTMKIIGDQIKSTPNEGPFASKVKSTIEQNNFLNSSHSICIGVCDAITSLGCSGFSLWKCAVVCGGPEDWPCIAICGAIWWAVCHYFDEYKDCSNLCTAYGF